mmetsp:Transcript_118215/g.376832  ORF Transcript_118215/g.376832 Transcript_118215/m.376832 type:complete len:264 (+) Transcript_118215:427-1218(+)
MILFEQPPGTMQCQLIFISSLAPPGRSRGASSQRVTKGSGGRKALPRMFVTLKGARDQAPGTQIWGISASKTARARRSTARARGVHRIGVGRQRRRRPHRRSPSSRHLLGRRISRQRCPRTFPHPARARRWRSQNGRKRLMACLCASRAARMLQRLFQDWPSLRRRGWADGVCRRLSGAVPTAEAAGRASDRRARVRTGALRRSPWRCLRMATEILMIWRQRTTPRLRRKRQTFPTNSRVTPTKKRACRTSSFLGVLGLWSAC